MERRNYNTKTITELTVAGGAKISNDDDILEEIRGFFTKIFKKQTWERTQLRSSKVLLRT